MADNNAPAVADLGDLWLSFWVSAIAAAIGAMALLNTALPLLWSGAAALPVGVAVGWSVCRNRQARRLVSQTAHLLLFWV